MIIRILLPPLPRWVGDFLHKIISHTPCIIDPVTPLTRGCEQNLLPHWFTASPVIYSVLSWRELGLFSCDTLSQHNPKVRPQCCGSVFMLSKYGIIQLLPSVLVKKPTSLKAETLSSHKSKHAHTLTGNP